MAKRVEQMYAFLAVDPKDNTEGVPAVPMGGVLMPLVGADMARVDDLKRVAQSFANEFGNELILCRFEVRTDLETIRPRE